MRPSRRIVAAGALIFTVFTVLRIRAVTLPLWWDEAFTVQRYIREGPQTILAADAYVANNHVAFSFFTWITTRLFGEGDVVVRLFAVIPAVIAVICIMRFLARQVDARAALIALTLTTTSTLWLTLSTQARGYGLVIFATTVMLLMAVNHDRKPRAANDVAFAAAGTLAMLTFPPAVAVYLAHAGVWLIRRERARLRLIAATAASGALTILIYWPILPLLLERSDRVGSRFAEPIGWLSPVLAPLQITGGPSFGVGTGLGPLDASGPTYLMFSHELSFGIGTATGIIAAVCGVLGIAFLFARHSSALGWHLLAGLGGSLILLAPFGFHLADRYLAFNLVHALVAITIGVSFLLGVFTQRRRAWHTAVAVVCVLMVAATLPVTWPTANVPVQAFRPAALDALQARERGAQIVTDQYHIGFRVYLPGVAVDRAENQDALEALVCDTPTPRVYLKNPDVTRYELPSCLIGVTPVTYPQQRQPGAISVWYLPQRYAPANPRTR